MDIEGGRKKIEWKEIGDKKRKKKRIENKDKRINREGEWTRRETVDRKRLIIYIDYYNLL